MSAKAQEISAENEARVLSDILMVKSMIIEISEKLDKLRAEIKMMKLNMQTSNMLRNRG